MICKKDFATLLICDIYSADSEVFNRTKMELKLLPLLVHEVFFASEVFNRTKMELKLRSAAEGRVRT